MFKKVISLLLAFVLTFSIVTFGASADDKICVSNVHGAMNLCCSISTFKIYEATLYTDGNKTDDIYLIALSGSTMSWDKADMKSMYSCIKSGVCKDNDYLSSLIANVNARIPDGAKIVLYGHSLGGMVAQQFAADEEMKEKYEILNILTMGSPYIPVKNREGDIHRMVDSGDVVPYLSLAGILNFWKGNPAYENNGYFGHPDEAHNISYGSAPIWKTYDCLGIKGGTNSIYY